MATIQESQLELAQELARTDPDAAMREVEWPRCSVASRVKVWSPTPFSVNPPSKVAAAQVIVAHSQVLDKDASQLKPDQLDVVMSALSHLQKREMALFQVARAYGDDAARRSEPGLAYRKIYDPDDNMGAVLSQQYITGVSGAIGVSSSTEGETSG